MISYFARPSTTALDALLASGELHVVQDEQLLRALQQYRQRLDTLRGSQESVFIDMRNTAVEIGLEHGVTPFDVIPEKTLLQTLEASEKMRAAMRAQAGLASAHNQQVTAARIAALDIIARLDAEH